MRFRNTRISTTSTTSQSNAKIPTFDEICEKLGFGDLKVDYRGGMNPLKRMAIWYYMYNTGAKLVDIARQAKRSHSTVWSGIKKFNAYLDYGDSESVRLRDKINSVMPVNGCVVDKKYNKLFFLMSTKYNIMLSNEDMREIIDVAVNIK